VRTYVVFKEADALWEQTCTDEEEQVGGTDQEPAEGDSRTTTVDDVTDDGTGDDTSDNGNGDRSGGLTERDLMINCQTNPLQADCGGLTPPTKTTASKPSRTRVMKGNRNSAHLPLRARLLAKASSSASPVAVWMLSSNAWDSLILHFTRDRSILRKARPMKKMMIEARREKTPSQICSDLAHRSERVV
jgi:hypothetical protein